MQRVIERYFTQASLETGNAKECMEVSDARKLLITVNCAHISRHWFPDHILPFQFGDAVVDIPTECCLHGYPQPAEYPISFPIVACIRDETNDEIALNPEASSNMSIPKSQDTSISKQTRIVPVLAAMA
jgi:hypothetical protein